MIPLILAAAGMAVQLYGQQQANAKQEEAEKQNASYFREQEAFTLQAMERESKIFQSKATGIFAAQVGSYVQGGIALSADSLQVLAGEKENMMEENAAIFQEGTFRARLAGLRANQSDETGAAIGDSTNYQAAAGLLTAATSYYK